jgi:hypothetical protein
MIHYSDLFIMGAFAMFELTRKSGISGKISTMSINTTREKYQTWVLDPDRPLIQEAFPELTANEREFILTGITPEEWDGIFSKEEKES